MSEEIVAIPLLDFASIAGTAAVQVGEHLLSVCVDQGGYRPIDFTPAALQLSLNALAARYEYALSNRMLKILAPAQDRDKPLERWKSTMDRLRSACNADRETAVQAGVAMAVAAARADLNEALGETVDIEFADAETCTHVVAKLLISFEAIREQAVTAWLYRDHSDLVGHAWNVAAFDATCPILLVSPLPFQPLLEAADLALQSAGVEYAVTTRTLIDTAQKVLSGRSTSSKADSPSENSALSIQASMAADPRT